MRRRLGRVRRQGSTFSRNGARALAFEPEDSIAAARRRLAGSRACASGSGAGRPSVAVPRLVCPAEACDGRVLANHVGIDSAPRRQRGRLARASVAVPGSMVAVAADARVDAPLQSAGVARVVILRRRGSARPAAPAQTVTGALVSSVGADRPSVAERPLGWLGSWALRPGAAGPACVSRPTDTGGPARARRAA